MKIRIKNLIAFQVYYMLIVNSFISILGLPSMIRYVLDINLILIMVLSISRLPTFFKNKNYNKFFLYIVFYVAFTIIVAMAKEVPGGQIFWAVRNNFFFLFFFMICIDVLHKEDCDRMMKNILLLHYYNLFCAIIEFFFMGKKNDFLGGMFGTAQGCNVHLNVYLVVISTYVIVRYLAKLEKVQTLLFVIFSNVALAAASELKFYYIELVMIFLFAYLLNRNKSSFKNVYIIVFATIGLIVGFNVLSAVNKESLSFFTSLDEFIGYNTQTEFRGVMRINRFTAISQVGTVFLKDKPLLKLLGMGLGYGEDSKTFAMFNSTFADHYRMTSYRNLSTSVIMLETGYVGLIMFAAIFVAIIFIGNRFKKEHNDFSVNFGQILSLMVIINCAYNAGIRIEIAYLTFFALSLMFVHKKDFDFEQSQRLAADTKPDNNKKHSKYIRNP